MAHHGSAVTLDLRITVKHYFVFDAVSPYVLQKSDKVMQSFGAWP